MSHSSVLLRFSTVGLVNTILDFVIFLSLVRLLELSFIWANSTAFFIATFNSFILNQCWTFRNSFRFNLVLVNKFSRFLAISSIGMMLGTLLIYWLQSYLWLEVVKTMSIAVTFLWNYFVARRFVFLK